jgi:peptide deformylase
MDELFIRLYIDPILHKPCELVTDLNEELFNILGKMFVCMVKNKGVGLSANQIGISKQFCVVNLDDGKVQMALINPKVISSSKEKEIMSESCLSIPGVRVPIKRSKEVVVEYLDLKGDIRGVQLTELDARIVLHEMDHLQGKMITDEGWNFKSKGGVKNER